ncbi:MAG: tetratricopeptide repeat protein [Patescibacteria group bacterium]|nr:tetratricopeptide repeat protein [Patescibacteria group bacterium]
MQKDKIQYAFMILVGLVVIAIIAITVIYFWQKHQVWQGYKNDPSKSKFVEQIETLEDKSNKTSDDWLSIGNSYYSLNDYADAISAYQKAIDAGSYDVGGLNLANAYAANKDYKNAEAQFRKLIDENLATADTYLKFADLYKNDWPGKSNSTIGILKEADSKLPNNYDILVNIAEYYLNSGDKSQALDYYNKALKLEPNNTALKKEMEMVR